MALRTVLITILCLLASASILTPAHADATTFRVLAGEAIAVDSPLVVDELLVEGVLTLGPADDVRIEAGRVLVLAGGRILASQLDPREGGPARNGPSITIVADSVVVGSGGRIEAGRGEAGPSMEGLGLVQGGDGGAGGNVIIVARHAQLLGQVVPGDGGAGGHASALGPRDGAFAAIGGAGGPSGTVHVDGAPWPSAATPMATGPDAGVPGLPGVTGVGCVAQQAGAPGATSTGVGGQGGNACADMRGGDGGDGGNGLCYGGPGGPGGEGAAGTAQGGPGGLGLQGGGNGGAASATGTGGAGGKGGWGGCVGGNGGRGGDGGGGVATGGKGGDSICGPPGLGGGATAEGAGGRGGAGGGGIISAGQAGPSGHGAVGSATAGAHGSMAGCPMTPSCPIPLIQSCRDDEPEGTAAR